TSVILCLSWIGVCLLGTTIDQCDTDTFTKNCVSWVRTILQLIQNSDRSELTSYCSELIGEILRYAVEFSELSRDVSNTSIPSIISAILSNKSTSLLSELGVAIIKLKASCCPCLVRLVKKQERCSRNASSGKNSVCPWQEQWNKILHTIHLLLDIAYEHAEAAVLRPSGKAVSQPEVLPLGDIPHAEPGRTYTLITRCNSLLTCLSTMIREDFNKIVTIPNDATVSLKSAVIIESVLLRASLPLIHQNAVDLLTSLMARQLRCSVYLCLEHWVHLTNSLPEGSGVVSKLMEEILDDIMPVTSQTKLLPSTAQNLGSSKMSKKQKFDTSANDMLTYRALKVLSAMLLACGGDIPPDKFKSVVHTYPIPFGRADCRQALYHVLLSCLLTDLPNVPSPVNHAVRLFSYGLQDADLGVSSFCQEALVISNSIIHPRSFPQVCSASGPLLVGTTEQPSTNGSFLMAPNQSVPESHLFSPLGQPSTQAVSQSILNGGVFRNDSSGVSTQTGVNSVGYREHIEIPEDSNFEVSLADKSNSSIEEKELRLSNGHLETSCGGNIESSDCCQGETGSSVATDSTSINTSVLQPTASSLNVLAAPLLNTQGFLTDLGKGHSDSTKKQSVNQASVEEREDASPSNPKKQGESTMVASQFKRRRVEDNSNKSNGEVCRESSNTGQSKDHLSGTTKDSSQATENGDDETSEMLSAFVDSYPDSDDQVSS
ncbi:hypothetical protein P5673_009275, partial [Acropora cervicornis]